MTIERALASTATPSRAGGHALRWMTATEVAARSAERPDWIVELYVAAGAITEVVGRPKGGKTTLLMAMLAATRAGEPFLDHPTRATNVVYLSEEGAATLRAVLGRTGLLDWDGLCVPDLTTARGLRWPEMVEQTLKKAREVDAGLVVVDTLGAWGAGRAATRRTTRATR